MAEVGAQDVADRHPDLAEVRRGFVPVPLRREARRTRGEDALGHMHILDPHVTVDDRRQRCPASRDTPDWNRPPPVQASGRRAP